MSVRVDKWLWSVRIFKSRSIATEACKAGRIKKNDKILKPSHEIGVKDVIQVAKDGFYFQFEVVELISKRVGFEIARNCYVNRTPEDELRKYDTWYVGKTGVEKREKGAGRPTKKERREIDTFKTGEAMHHLPSMDWDNFE
ncbi:MAG TPA: RNA-binding S4 domain-containing protein [Saprospiraceae bacterium]|nr:RNA-binding protein [Saprospirales bacterium]HRQ30281.1 RNA-binding S4 domain-containing protein [Saprospiraceae bacterium]